MSQDLFAAFGDAPAPSEPGGSVAKAEKDPWTSEPSQANLQGQAVNGQASQVATETVDDEDDFGDFEDATISQYASAVPESIRPESANVSIRLEPSKGPSASFPPKAQNPKDPPKAPSNSKVGRHPFADHMDFLFSGGDDEYDAGNDDLEDLSKNPEAAMAYSKRMIAEQEAQMSNATPLPFSPRHTTPVVSNPSSARNKLQKKSGYVPTKDPNVLFDVENVSEHESENDDFGEFEDAPVLSKKLAIPSQRSPAKLQKKSGPPLASRPAKQGSKPPMPAIDLLGLSDPVMSPTVNFHQQHMSQSSIMSPRSEHAESILGTSKADSMVRPPTAGSLWSEDETWDDFDASEATKVPASHHNHSRPASSSMLSPNPTPTTGRRKASTEDTPPPTNIPPPAVLLSVFPSSFAAAQDALLGNLSKLNSTQKQQLLGHPATYQFLQGYLNNGMALAHIVAGRKLRWKRDQILSQSMRIGPAAAGGKGGMKLNSIDKSEQIKEEREVTDVVAQWRAQVGKLRTAVSGASANCTGSTIKLPPVPEIVEAPMAVKTLKAAEGGFTAPHACALCGLKREERVHKVDIDVNDSFGEWWIEGMNMHVSCKNWWDENKSKLKSR